MKAGDLVSTTIDTHKSQPVSSPLFGGSRLFRSLLATSLLLIIPHSIQAQTRPNVVVILADDAGWGDFSTHGGKVPTPHIDRLFKEGVELRQFMGWCVCSPTRAMLLTGRHPFRVGTGPEVGGELSSEETTIAEGFQAAGYRTGVFGKWHNGDDPDTPAFRAAFAEAFRNTPNKKLKGGLGANAHGFDEAWVYYGGGADHFTRRTIQGHGPISWWHNREFQPDDKGYTDDLVTRHALEFLHANRERPFFCYIPFHLVHAPVQAKDDDLKHISEKEAASLPAASPKATTEHKWIHAAMLHALDTNVGTILSALDHEGLRENTIVVFTSDNGAMESGSSLPLRGAKHTIYEGGVRLPTVIHWPKGGLSGGRSWNGLCGHLDLFPTLIDMAGLKMPATRPLDGRNIWPALRERASTRPVESYYWAWRNEDALRTADWKLHRFADRVELYNIAEDPNETQDCSAAHPEVVRDLTQKMESWIESLGAAVSHRPPPSRWHGEPKPSGDVLAIEVTVTDRAKPNEKLIVPFASWDGRGMATDWIEFDLAFAPNPSRKRPYYTPYRGTEAAAKLLFTRGTGVDQLGREQSSGPVTDGKKLVWEHRVIGLAANGPGPLPKHGLVFGGLPPGTYTVYLDNLRLRQADGTMITIWSGSSDTVSRRIPDSPAFRSVHVRTVSADRISSPGEKSRGD